MTARLFAKSAVALFALAFLVIGGIAGGTTPAQARVFIGFGVAPWGWGYPYPYGPYAYPYYAPPPVVYAPPIYTAPPAYAPTAPSAAESSTWYYCDNPSGYYPYVKQCNTAWRPVAARPPQE